MDNKLVLKYYEFYMKIIGPLANCMFYIQAYKIFTTKSAEAISMPAFILSAVGLGSWLIYGILLDNKPIILANAVGVLGAALVLTLTLLYG